VEHRFQGERLETLIKRNSETAQRRKAEVAKFRLNIGHGLLGKHLKRFNIVDSDICKLCNIGTQDREQLRSCSILQDKLSDIDNFESMTKTGYLFCNNGSDTIGLSFNVVRR
jgi:hypothetical protein